MMLVQKQAHRSLEHNGIPRNKATHIQLSELRQSWQKQAMGKVIKLSYLLNGAGRTG